MAATDAIVNVKVVGGQSLTQLENAISKLQNRFGGLKTAVAGLGLAAFTRNAFQAADAMVDLSNSTGIAIGSIIELQYATEAAGGRLDQVNNAVIKFGLSIDEAAQGSVKLQDAFAKVGVSLDELGSLSEDQLLQEVAKGFLAIDDSARAAGIANDIFGKSIRGIDIKQFAQELLSSRGSYDQYTEAVEKAAELQGKLDRALIDVRIAFLQVISPFVTFIESMKASEGGIERFTNLIRLLTIALSVLAGGALLRGLATVIGSIGRGLSVLFTGSRGVFAVNGPLMTQLRAILPLIGGGLGGAIATGMTDGAEEGANNVRAIASSLDDVSMDSIKAYSEGLKKLQAQLKAGTISQEEFNKKVQELGAGVQTNTQIAAREVIRTKDLELQKIKEIGIEYRKNYDTYMEGLKRQHEALFLSEQELAARNAYNEVIDKANDKIEELAEAQRNLSAADKYKAPAYEKEIDAIQATMEADAQAAAQRARNTANQLVLNEELIKDIEMLNTMLRDDQALGALQRQAELIGLTGDALAEKSIELGVQEELENRLLSIQEKRNQLAKDAEKLGKDRVANEIERLNEEERMAREYADRRLKIEKDLNEKTKALRNDTSAATKKYLEDLARSIDPAVLTAKRWEAVFGGIENAIDKLVTTGKFNFKDFALAIIADLLKIQMRAIVVQAILAAIGAIFGKAPTLGTGGGSGISTVGFAANGASTMAGKPFVVGEQGPELFVPRTAGNIVPNDALKGNNVNAPVTNNYNTYNINAVDAKSVAQLFAENRKSLLGAVGMAQKEMPYMI